MAPMGGPELAGERAGGVKVEKVVVAVRVVLVGVAVVGVWVTPAESACAQVGHGSRVDGAAIGGGPVCVTAGGGAIVLVDDDVLAVVGAGGAGEGVEAGLEVVGAPGVELGVSADMSLHPARWLRRQARCRFETAEAGGATPKAQPAGTRKQHSSSPP